MIKMAYKSDRSFNPLKKCMVLLAIASAFCFFAVFAGTSKCYAETKVYQQFDNIYCYGGASITATVSDDGLSGCITFRDPTVAVYKWTEDHPLTSIGGTPIKDIVKFKSGGYVDSFYFDYGTLILHPAWALGYTNRLNFYANAAGPKGIGSGRGYLRFYDWYGDYTDKEDSFELSIWSSSLKTHKVSDYYRHFSYDDPQPAIKKIEWHS